MRPGTERRAREWFLLPKATRNVPVQKGSFPNWLLPIPRVPAHSSLLHSVVHGAPGAVAAAAPVPGPIINTDSQHRPQDGTCVLMRSLLNLTGAEGALPRALDGAGPPHDSLSRILCVSSVVSISRENNQQIWWFFFFCLISTFPC